MQSSLENYFSVLQLSYFQLEQVREYDHDPSIEIDQSKIEIYYSIDQGFFGSVYLVKYNNQFAALKCSKGNVTDIRTKLYRQNYRTAGGTNK